MHSVDPRSAADRQEDSRDADMSAFFAAYYTTHVAQRKGTLDRAYLEARSRYYDRFWTTLVPAPRNARILDAGCGVGALVWWLQQRGYPLAEGVDVSAELIQRGAELGVKNLHTADIADHLRDRVGDYDCIIFRDVLEHFPRSPMIRLLETTRSALAPGGTVVIQVPNAESPAWGRIRYGDFTHEMAFTASSLAQLLAVTRFRPVAFAGAGPIAERKRDLPRYALWKAIEVGYKLLLYGVSGRRGAIVTESIMAVATPGILDGLSEGRP